MKRRRRNVVDSDEGSDVGSQASDSNSTTNSSTAAVKQKPTARKRGRPPAKKTAQTLQDNSDDGGSTRPNTPHNANNDQSEEDNSDSNSTVNSSSATVNQKPTARKRGRPPAKETAQTLQDNSDNGGSTRPSTPHNANNDQSEEDNSDSDSTVNSSSATVNQKPTASKRGRPPAKETAQTLQDNSDNGGSTRPSTPHNANNDQSEENNSDSDSAVNSSRATVNQKPTARKRGRPPAKKTAQTLQDNSDDGGSTRPNTPHNANYDQSEEDNSDSDSIASSFTAAVKQKLTARKRGRPPAATKKKAQTLQDDSDEEEPTQPNTPQNADNDQSDNEENSSDSDYIADSISGPKRRPGRPSSANKRLRLQNGSQRDTSPQPSTSQNGIIHQVPESESDSESNSADSDYGPINEKNLAKKKPPGKKQPGRVTSPRAAKKKPINYANSINSSVSNSQLSASFKKGCKPAPSFDASMDTKLVESLAQKLVYFLLIEDQKKYAIRRKGIITHVLKDDNTPKMYSAVTKKANIILKKTYGMELMKLENQTDSYLLINILGRELGVHDYIDLPRIKQQQHGLISFLLTVIYMNENVITEDELTRCLKPLGIDLTSKRMHPVFGDVKKYITTELVKQMYLKYECISKEPPKYEFTWGLRAKQEFDKRDLLQFACTIMDDTSPEDWRIQFRDAEASAKPNAEN